ncbi:DUF3306 domain-containing protein [Comamonadaceae bacterium M7527]|nr:DUF3306 domain-containing protein [Comamonadaceae bacterium M7527]
MSDSFFSRWSRQKSLQRDLDQARDQATTKSTPLAPTRPALTGEGEDTKPLVVGEEAAPADQPMPTLEDTASLEVGANVSRFLRDGVSEAVKGAALKKLFADPAYNVISEMDDYVEDYSKMATMTKLEVSKLQQSKDLYLFEDPPWKVQAEAEAKAKAAAQAQAASDGVASSQDNNNDQPHNDQPVRADHVQGTTDAEQPADTDPDEGETTHRQAPP